MDAQKDAERVGELKKLGAEITLLEHSIAVLHWDLETCAPEDAVGERSEQLALLEGIVHDKITNPRVGELFDLLGVSIEAPHGERELPAIDGSFLRTLHRRHWQSSRIPKELVEEMARRTSVARKVWAQARKEEDFSLFAPELAEILKLTRELSKALAIGTHPYDALLDQYEMGMTKGELDRIFNPLKRELIALVEELKASPRIPVEFLERDYPEAAQESFSRFILSELNFPMSRGRLDVSTHPFTSTLGGNDVRITTRYGEKNPFDSLFSTIHEAGHALYELGIRQDILGNVMATGTSLGIHESQSRTWENVIGRSREFWTRYFPEAVKLFPGALKDTSVEEFYRGINRVEPSFIRVGADEVTYSLHVILRYELEVAMLEGQLEVTELPAAWNDKMDEFLGIRPGSPSLGVLQDVHWSAGLIGYFPTYALGNLYGAHFTRKMEEELPGWRRDIEAGRLSNIHDWLSKNIYYHGSIYTARELLHNLTGEELAPDYFIAYLKGKYREIYS